MTLARAKYVQRDLPQQEVADTCACASRLWWPTGDFGFMAGIALIVLATAWGCENTETRARAALLDSCRKAMDAKAPVPDVCTAAMGKSR